MLDKEIAWINGRLTNEVQLVTEWQRTYEVSSSAPGIGDGVAYTPLGELPELGELSNSEISALCGLPPSIEIVDK
ncbi:MAG: hypothetical protein KUG83_01945 [Gammaproteobacteria bacterium]|nr:hypothetical protein [Gammaproteobacteria bacterium]